VPPERGVALAGLEAQDAAGGRVVVPYRVGLRRGQRRAAGTGACRDRGRIRGPPPVGGSGILGLGLAERVGRGQRRGDSYSQASQVLRRDGATGAGGVDRLAGLSEPASSYRLGAGHGRRARRGRALISRFPQPRSPPMRKAEDLGRRQQPWRGRLGSGLASTVEGRVYVRDHGRHLRDRQALRLAPAAPVQSRPQP
jgi:hypothetical protein